MTIKSKSGRMLESFTNTVIIEAEFLQWSFIKEVSTIKDICWPLHSLIYLLIVNSLETIPFSKKNYGMRAHSCFFSWLNLLHFSSIIFFPQILPFHFINKLHNLSGTFYSLVSGSWIRSRAPSSSMNLHISTAGDYLGSFVSFLKAVPKIQICLFLML